MHLHQNNIGPVPVQRNRQSKTDAGCFSEQGFIIWKTPQEIDQTSDAKVL
jgi:hypothetical protein